jgi:glycosyltransferase involved in cell wall biosynthesis
VSSTRPFFSIVLITYNRPQLFEWVLRSLHAQTCKDFELIVVENGSCYSHLADLPNVDMTTTLSLSRNVFDWEALNMGYQVAQGEVILPFLADDDFLTQNCLGVVKKIFSNLQVNSLSVGSIGFSHTHLKVTGNNPKDFFTGDLYNFRAREMVLDYCSGWGIGTHSLKRVLKSGHSSGLFIRKSKIESAVRQQGTFFYPIFTDISLFSTILQSSHHHYFDAPLILISEGHARALDGRNSGRHEKWGERVKFIQCSPLKAPTFTNLGMESHALVMVRSGMWFDHSMLRYDFFLRHLKEILADSTSLDHMKTDLEELIPHFLGAANAVGIDIQNAKLFFKSKLDEIARRERHLDVAETKNHTSRHIGFESSWELIDSTLQWLTSFTPDIVRVHPLE